MSNVLFINGQPLVYSYKYLGILLHLICADQHTYLHFVLKCPYQCICKICNRACQKFICCWALEQLVYIRHLSVPILNMQLLFGTLTCLLYLYKIVHGFVDFPSVQALL